MALSEVAIEKNASSVIIVEDHPLFCEALRMVVERAMPEAEIHCYQEGSAVLSIPSDTPDTQLLIMDLILPDFDWRKALSEIRHRSPDLRILAISNLEDEDTILDAISCGADGFLSKSASAEVSEHVIRLVAAGGTYVPRNIMTDAPARSGGDGRGTIRRRNKTGEHRESEFANLTSRQLEVLQELSAGKSNKDISERLGISISTVKIHVNAVLQRLGLRNRTEAALLAYRRFNKQKGEAS